MEKNKTYYEILDHVTAIIKENNENHIPTSRQEIEKALDKVKLESRRLKLSKDEIKQYIDDFIRNSEIDELKNDDKHQQFIESLQQYNEKKGIDKQIQAEAKKDDKDDHPYKAKTGYFYHKDR